MSTMSKQLNSTVKSDNASSALPPPAGSSPTRAIDLQSATVIILAALRSSQLTRLLDRFMKAAAFSFLEIFLLAFLAVPVSFSGDAVLDGARKEGHVVVYASMETQSAQRLTVAFEKKYPFIKVDATRIGSERMARRRVGEAQSKQVQADVVSQAGFDFYGLLQKGMFESYVSPERSALPTDYRDDKG